MDAHEIILSLRQRGIVLRASGDKLQLRVPRGVLTEEDLAALRQHKPALIALLAAESPPPAPSSSTSATCPDCGSSATRLGAFTLDDGRGRYECSQCGRVFWALPRRGESPPPSTWTDAYADLDDAHHQSVVDADIARHGYYTLLREYPAPAEPPEAIWARAGLPVLAREE